MPHETPEIAPRGTWNDDTASEAGAAARRSVSAPYRDPLDAARARRVALRRELSRIDRLLAEAEQAPPDAGALQRLLADPPHVRRFARAAEWVRRATVFGVPIVLAAWLGASLAPAAPAPGPAVVVAHDAPGIVRLDGTRFVIARSMLDRLLESQFAAGRLDPVLEKGRIVGLRVADAGSDDAAALGLREGDVVLAVDEHALWRPDGAREAYDTLRTASSFVLFVRRGREVRRLAYEVVG